MEQKDTYKKIRGSHFVIAIILLITGVASPFVSVQVTDSFCKGENFCNIFGGSFIGLIFVFIGLILLSLSIMFFISSFKKEKVVNKLDN